MSRLCDPSALQLRTIPAVLAVTIKTYLYFLFTTFSVGLVTNISKAICGRLRPNFLDVCRPNWTTVKCETVNGLPNYVTGTGSNIDTYYTLNFVPANIARNY